MKTSYLPRLADRVDFTWATYNIFTWNTGELFVIIFCGTIPTLKPALDFVLRITSRSDSGDDTTSSWSKNGVWPSSNSRKDQSRRSQDGDTETIGILLDEQRMGQDDHRIPLSVRSMHSGRSTASHYRHSTTNNQ